MNSIAIGNGAGLSGQQSYAIAIGYNAGLSNQSSKSIIINADLSGYTPDASGLYINPVRNTSGWIHKNGLYYDTGRKEIRYDTTKTFVIPHPIDNNKYLVHACLEGPEAGVYYRGKGTITNNEYIKINLPHYLKYIGTNYSINITRIFSGKKISEQYETSEIEDNSFTVYGPNGSFYWIVFAEREKINVEPNINNVDIKGIGPYKYVTHQK